MDWIYRLATQSIIHMIFIIIGFLYIVFFFLATSFGNILIREQERPFYQNLIHSICVGGVLYYEQCKHIQISKHWLSNHRHSKGLFTLRINFKIRPEKTTEQGVLLRIKKNLLKCTWVVKCHFTSRCLNMSNRLENLFDFCQELSFFTGIFASDRRGMKRTKKKWISANKFAVRNAEIHFLFFETFAHFHFTNTAI